MAHRRVLSTAAAGLGLLGTIWFVAMPPGTGTEVFTWLSLSIMIGASAGSAIAGSIVQAGGWRAGVVLAIALPTLGLPLLLTGRRLLPSPAAAA